MNKGHLQLLHSKYQSLSRHLRTLIKTGRYTTLSLSRRISLTKRWLRYHTRIAKWRPQAISGMGIGLYMVLTASTCHHFTLSPDPTPFGLTNQGAYNTPTFADIDGDGDLDVFVGNQSGQIAFFRHNENSTDEKFDLEFFSFAFGLYISGRNSAPTFADIDGDGDLDAFIGEENGNINFFENTGSASNPIFVEDTNISLPFGISDVGAYSVPSFADIDGDGDLDLFIGEEDGNINFFENTGSVTSANFVLDPNSEPFGLTDVGAHSAPTFADFNGDGVLDAFIGEKDGNTNIFTNVNLQNPSFTLAAGSDPLGISDVGEHSTPAFADIDGDGDLDLFVGEKDGNTNFFAGTAGDASFILNSISSPFGSSNVGDYSAPAFADVDGDGDLDAFLGAENGSINFFRNGTASASGSFTFESAYIGFNAYSDNSTPAFMDIDGDGDLDAFVGGANGNIHFFRNVSTSTGVSFQTLGFIDPYGLANTGNHSTPTFADIDGDGDLDAFIGLENGDISFFRNGGDPTFASFELISTGSPVGFTTYGNNSAPTFADIDNDGDLDAFVGNDFGVIYLFQNTGSFSSPSFTTPGNSSPLGLSYVAANATPVFADIDNDGDLDAFVGEENGNINFFENRPCKSSHNVHHVQLAQDIFLTQEELTSRAVIRNGRDATFSAGTGMTLDTLFEVQQGAIFMGIMDGCPIE